MKIGAETAADRIAAEAVVAAAFPTPEGAAEPIEVPLLRRLRATADFRPRWSLVATDDAGVVVGHVIATLGRLPGSVAAGVGPLAVAPDHQGLGIGSGLMEYLIARCQTDGVDVLCLLGEPDYYRRFGFQAAADLGIDSPDPAWGPYFQALALSSGAQHPGPRGRFTYSDPFNDL